MHIARAKPGILETIRLDPDYYHPQHISDAEHLKSFGAVELGRVGRFFAGPFGSKLPSNLYLDRGIPLFRVGNVGAMEINLNNMAHLAPAVHAELKSSEVLPGDLLIVKASVGEKIGKVPEWMPRANITQHIIALRSNKSVDIDFVTAFLFCSYGRRQLIRRSLGSIIQYLGVNDARTVLLPDICSTAQIHIGNRVRQAERLREWAQLTEKNIRIWHEQFIPKQNGLAFHKITRKVNGFLLTDRLDAHFYPAVVEDYFAKIEYSPQQLKILCKALYNGQTQHDSEETKCAQVTVANLSSLFLSGRPRNVEYPPNTEKFLKEHDLLMCNAAHSKSYIGREITYVHSDEPILPSTEVMVIRTDRSKVPASYLRAYLLTHIGYIQIQSTIRGISAHSYPADVATIQIPIPILQGEAKEQWLLTDEAMLKAGQANSIAGKLTTAAKLLVESLIEGHLTESELEAAQQALENGDNSLDKAILARLTAKGMDIEGEPPLFPDLDALYQLLAEAEAATDTDAEAKSTDEQTYATS